MHVPFNDFTTFYTENMDDYTAAFTRVLNSGWYILGTEVEQFEKQFADYLGVEQVIGVANGLEALQISLLALEIGLGDEVITTPLSAFATTLAIRAVGAEPVFVDTDQAGLLTADAIEQAITKKTKAVIPVHLYGNPCNVQAIAELCAAHSLHLIEDAAQAHGTQYQNKKVGSTGVLNCFSFYPTKNLGCIGDGGAVATNSLELAQICKSLRNYGQEKKYVHTAFGLNSRLDELQAAFLQMRLRSLDTENTRRLAVATNYKKLLAGVGDIRFISPDTGGNGHLCALRTAHRDPLQNYLHEKSIEALVHYPATIPDQPVFGDSYQTAELPNARAICAEVLSLPCHPNIKPEQIEYVVSEVNNFFKEVKNA